MPFPIFTQPAGKCAGLPPDLSCSRSFIPEICFNFAGNKVNGSESGIIHRTQAAERKRDAFGIGADCPYRTGGYCLGGLRDAAFHIHHYGL